VILTERPLWTPTAPAGYRYDPYSGLYLPHVDAWSRSEQHWEEVEHSLDTESWFLTRHDLIAATEPTYVPPDPLVISNLAHQFWTRFSYLSEERADPAWYLADTVHPDHVEVLLDLARTGHEAEFKELAGAVGVPRKDLDDMWQGTTSRLHRKEA
jgi:hypothetical protein